MMKMDLMRVKLKFSFIQILVVLGLNLVLILMEKLLETYLGFLYLSLQTETLWPQEPWEVELLLATPKFMVTITLRGLRWALI